MAAFLFFLFMAFALTTLLLVIALSNWRDTKTLEYEDKVNARNTSFQWTNDYQVVGLLKVYSKEIVCYDDALLSCGAGIQIDLIVNHVHRHIRINDVFYKEDSLFNMFDDTTSIEECLVNVRDTFNVMAEQGQIPQDSFDCFLEVLESISIFGGLYNQNRVVRESDNTFSYNFDLGNWEEDLA